MEEKRSGSTREEYSSALRHIDRAWWFDVTGLAVGRATGFCLLLRRLLFPFFVHLFHYTSR